MACSWTYQQASHLHNRHACNARQHGYSFLNPVYHINIRFPQKKHFTPKDRSIQGWMEVSSEEWSRPLHPHFHSRRQKHQFLMADCCLTPCLLRRHPSRSLLAAFPKQLGVFTLLKAIHILPCSFAFHVNDPYVFLWERSNIALSLLKHKSLLQ